MKIAIIGGTFNPPHFAHLFFANEVRQKLKYDKIVFVPSSISAHKVKDINTLDKDRLNMLNLAIKNLPWAMVSECDLNRGGVTRTIDTISDIIREFSLDSKPGFILGDDLVEGFSNWKDPELIAEKSDLIIGIRKNVDFNFLYKHQTVDNRVFPLSSSEIRERVFNGFDIDFLIPDKVIEYIKKNELYSANY